MIILKQNTYITPVTNIQNTIYINNSKLQLDKVKCIIYYLHLINNIIHTPKAIIKWENIYTNFKLKYQLIASTRAPDITTTLLFCSFCWSIFDSLESLKISSWGPSVNDFHLAYFNSAVSDPTFVRNLAFSVGFFSGGIQLFSLQASS